MINERHCFETRRHSVPSLTDIQNEDEMTQIDKDLIGVVFQASSSLGSGLGATTFTAIAQAESWQSLASLLASLAAFLAALQFVGAVWQMPAAYCRAAV